MGDHDGIGVAEAIEALRRELTEAMTEGDYERARLRFRLQEPVVVVLALDAELAERRRPRDRRRRAHPSSGRR
jgi:hypothetical protein